MTRILPAKDASIKAARHEGGPFTEYRISQNAGLVLAVMPADGDGRSERVWRLVYSATIAGKRVHRRVRIGKYGTLGQGVTLAEARAEAARLMALVDRGRDPFAEAKVEAATNARAALTFEAMCEEYLQARSALASVNEMARELRVNAYPALSAKRPAEITPADVDAVASAMLARGADQGARMLIVRLKALFNFVLDSPEMADRYGVTSNPAERLARRRAGAASKFAKAPPKDRFLTDEEIALFWHALSTSKYPPQVQLALKLILTTGQRPGECRQIESAHISKDGSTWTIPVHLVKNRKRDHIVPVSPLASHILQQADDLRRGSKFFFPYFKGAARIEDGPIIDVILSWRMKVLFRDFLPNLKPATPHDLRRTAATGLRALGTAQEIVGLILNHTGIGVTATVYDQYPAMTERRAALDSWSAHLIGITGTALLSTDTPSIEPVGFFQKRN